MTVVLLTRYVPDNPVRPGGWIVSNYYRLLERVGAGMVTTAPGMFASFSCCRPGWSPGPAVTRGPGQEDRLRPELIGDAGPWRVFEDMISLASCSSSLNVVGFRRSMVS